MPQRWARLRTARLVSLTLAHAGHVFRGFPIHTFATACQVARSPVRIRPIYSALESFYFQASNGSVALPVAGYDYNSDWTLLLTGLSPARMAVSLAAPDPYVRLSRIRLVWGFLCQATSTPFLSCFVIPFFCSTRAASILSSRPHISIAVCAQRRSRTALVWGFLCQATSTPFLSCFVI